MLDTPLIILVIVLALAFDFINGFHDTANAIATCVSTRAIRPGLAIIGTAVLNFIGAMISTGVAKTIGGDIVTSPAMINELVIIAGLTFPRTDWRHDWRRCFFSWRGSAQRLGHY